MVERKKTNLLKARKAVRGPTFLEICLETDRILPAHMGQAMSQTSHYGSPHGTLATKIPCTACMVLLKTLGGDGKTTIGTQVEFSWRDIAVYPRVAPHLTETVPTQALHLLPAS